MNLQLQEVSRIFNDRHTGWHVMPDKFLSRLTLSGHVKQAKEYHQKNMTINRFSSHRNNIYSHMDDKKPWEMVVWCNKNFL